MTKFRIATNLGVAAVLTLLVSFIIHRSTANPALRYMSDVMFPISAVILAIAAVFFLVARDIDGPPMES